MSEIRYDLITGNAVIISENRANRPIEIANKTEEQISNINGKLTSCPFCPGNEHETPPDLIKKGNPWTIRVVPNKYPAICTDPFVVNEDNSNKSVLGSHYVIIDSNNHYNYLHNMTTEEISVLLHVYSELLTDLYKYDYIKYVQIFKNYKTQGGASLEHTHSQALAMSFIPKRIESILSNAEQYLNNNSSCLFCSIIDKELIDARRIISETDKFVAIAPYASTQAYEFVIYPKKHMSRFQDMLEEDYIELAQLLHKLFLKLYVCLNNPAYNLYIQTINSQNNYFHWSINVVPRTNIQAGFELSTGVMLNTVSPEKTKEILS